MSRTDGAAPACTHRQRNRSRSCVPACAGTLRDDPQDEPAAITRKLVSSKSSDVRIEHVGSISVPDLAAQPIIHVNVDVADSSDESSYLSALVAADLALRSEFIPGLNRDHASLMLIRAIILFESPRIL